VLSSVWIEKRSLIYHTLLGYPCCQPSYHCRQLSQLMVVVRWLNIT